MLKKSKKKSKPNANVKEKPNEENLMRIVGQSTKFSKQLQNYIKSGKGGNEPKGKPTRAEVKKAIDDYFRNESETLDSGIKALSNE